MSKTPTFLSATSFSRLPFMRSHGYIQNLMVSSVAAVVILGNLWLRSLSSNHHVDAFPSQVLAVHGFDRAQYCSVFDDGPKRRDKIAIFSDSLSLSSITVSQTNFASVNSARSSSLSLFLASCSAACSEHQIF